MTRRLLTFALLLTVGLVAMVWAEPAQKTSQDATPAAQTPKAVPQRANTHLDEILLHEGWESGTLNGWETVDLTNIPGTWHLDSYRAFGGSGTSWWSGDPDVGPNGGYLNGWYMNLQTPSITLPAGTPMLRFWHRYRVEGPSGAEPPYNAWDGMNLRVSTDGGTNWTIVPSTACTPAYGGTSLYSFGIQHCEGPNIPGWVGSDSAWHQQTVNLSAWAGHAVRIRFAFASDPGFCTSDDATLFGWMVDNIRVYNGTDTIFTDNCEAVGDWTVSAGRAPGGDLWRVVQDTDPENGTHVLVCNNVATSLYNPGMDNAIMSPYVDLRTIGFGTIVVDVKVKGDVWCPDPDVDDNCDAWGCEVSADSGRTWCAMTNPTCDANDTSYRFVGDVANWTWFSEGFTSEFEDLYQLAGHVVRFRLYQESGCDANVAVGMMFDDFTVTHTPGYPNDVTCASIQVRYPNVAGRPFRVKGYFANPGQNAQNDVGSWFRYLPGGTWRILGLPFSLQHNATISRDTVITINTPGLYQFQARSALPSDQNLMNDTANVFGVDVLPAGSELEIGYDYHTLSDTFYLFNGFDTGEGALVRFTPVSDSVVRRFDLNDIKIQFSEMQTVNNQPIRLHIYSGGTAAPGIEIYTADIQVALSETGTTVWKTVDVSSDVDTRNITRDFWVWLETTNAGPAPRYPAILADNAEPWDDIHHYTWGGVGTVPDAQDYFFQLHAVISDASAADDQPIELPSAWSVGQNYPNPFNPTTEIRFAVPRTEMVTVKVFNLMGQEVATLADGMMQPGIHTVTFNGNDLASGVYLYKVESATFSATRKMLLMK